MKWQNFQYDGTAYDLKHLYPFTMNVIVPAKDKKPAQVFSFQVRFSHHCFTRTTKFDDSPLLTYRDNRQSRTFCFDRYALSFHLPGIIHSIENRHCFHTGHGNFFVVEIVTTEGETVDYEVYFDISKARKGDMSLYVQSAYVRSEKGKVTRPKRRKIKFSIIAYNRKHNKPIKAPK